MKFDHDLQRHFQFALDLLIARRTVTPMLIVLLLVVLTLGCKPTLPDADGEENTKVVAAPDPMSVLIIDNQKLGDDIVRYWAAERDGEVNVIHRELQEWEDQSFKIDADVDLVIFPPLYLGELAERELVKKLNYEQWNYDEVNKSSIMTHYRERIVRYRSEPYGLPLGNPHLAMFYNRSAIELDSNVVMTWDRLERQLKSENAVQTWQSMGNDTNPRLDMPLGENWAGRTLLARVAPGVMTRGSFSTLFDPNDLSPMVDSKPFVDGLEQLKRISTKRSLDSTAEDVFQVLINGESIGGLCYPSSGFSKTAETTNPEAARQLIVTTPPGSELVFDQRTSEWKERFDSSQIEVDYFGFEGMMVSMASSSRYPGTALELMIWLADRRTSTKLLSEYKTVGPFRASHLGDITRWTGEQMSLDLGDDYSQLIETIHRRSLVMTFPRIPGASKYLDVLDRGVRAYLKDGGDAQATLTQVAKQWDEITDELGRKKQVKALRNELGF
ncbi:MAG: hypothetical protein AAFN77_01785 [Planctomycetota bacterium]